jgi:Calcineurin-like phosphoesterase
MCKRRVLAWIILAPLGSGCMDLDLLQRTGPCRPDERCCDNHASRSGAANNCTPTSPTDAKSLEDVVAKKDATPPDAGSDLVSAEAPALPDASATDSDNPSNGSADSGLADIFPPNPTVVVLPDTQFYAAAYPEIFHAQTKWIADNRASANLVAVLHEGDVVDDTASSDQWQVASDSFATLDGVIPYLVPAGNHDEGSDRQGLMDQFFPASRSSQYAWFGGTFEPDRTENSYATVAIGDTTWLLLALEFGPRNAVVTWADGVLKANADKPAILVTHAYLYNDGTRYDYSKTPPQSFDPHGYNYTPLAGVNDGEQLWQNLIVTNENVRLVLSGHCLGDPAVARLTSTRPSGSMVQQILANYQTCADLSCPQMSQIKGGNGYLRLLEFDKANQVLRVHTYSPYLNQYMDGDDAEDFVLPLPQ